MQIQLNRVLVTLAIIVVLLVANVSISMDAVLANTSEEVTEDVVENEEEQETTSETNQEETNDSENDEVKEETSEDTESSDKSSEEDVDEESSEVEEEEDKESEEATHSEEKENAEVTEETEEDTSTSKENTENETSEENTEDDTSSEDETEEPSTFSAEATTMQDTSWVTPFKEDLTRLGFGGMNINDTYGNFTAKRVGEFQAYYGLNVNKEADEATLAKLDDILSSPFQKGETHEDTIELKKLLTWLGYGNMNINEIYGSFTETRVQQFQRDHGLKDHGIADEPTWNKLREIVDTVFQVGNEHPGVVELKRNLTTLGFGNMNINEVYGNFTETRVRQFQANYGLSATGQVDQKTLKKIDELLKVSFYQGKTDSDVVSLKEGLTKVGFGNMNINEIYGNFTETRVSQFQDYYGLRATGVADPQTVEKLNQVVNSPFQEGETHENTIELKNLLTWLGYGNMNINEIYGSFTETRVRQFQRDHGLKDNGIADEQTWNLLSEMIDTVFQVGNEHPGVVELKRKLTTLGFGNMNINEVYGNFTETRVRQFQDYYGLRVTGVADYQTVELLYEIADSPFQEGETHDDTIELKRLLTWLGYGNMNINEIYGSFTETRVGQFQRDHGLKDHGIADEPTWDKLREMVNTVFQVGNEHPGVVELKQNLTTLGFGNMNINEVYGNFTETRVRQFQSAYGLKVDGQVGQETLEKIDELLRVSFYQGKTDSNVISLKEGLTKLGFGNMNINEIYGNFTAIRVSQFQDYYDLRATGVADPQTVELLNEIVDTPFQEGESHSSVSTLKEKLKRIGFGGMNINEAYGSYTAKRVSEFQSLYGLKANGIVDPVTESHIDQIYNSPYQNGKEHEDMIKFKEMLNKIGYGYINVNETFGSFSEQKVKEFQGDMELPVSGILDKLTIEKLTEVFERKIIYYETPYDTTVNEQLNLQLGLSTPPQTDLYSSSHGYILTDNLNFEQNGSITGSGVNVRSAPDTTKNNVEYTLARGTTFEYIKNVTGTSVGGNTEWYEIKYKGKTLYVHNSLASKKSLSATVKAVSNIYESKRTDSHTYYRLSSGSSVTVVSKGSTWTEINGRTWRNAKRNDVLQYLDPQKQDDFQHLLLSSSPNVSSSQINRVLDGKGVLDGEGSAFIEASKKHEVNEIYLISHALLETGHGTSDLAKGIEVGENSSGNPVLVNSSNRSDLTNVEEVYNMFGIGAYDGSAKRDGAIRAYKEGWDSVDKAIIGGAKFIGESYIHNQNQQNTLYKMRWNPSAPGYPQYATDMGWAAKQVSNIKSMYDKLDNPILVFDIPKYR